MLHLPQCFLHSSSQKDGDPFLCFCFRIVEPTLFFSSPRVTSNFACFHSWIFSQHSRGRFNGISRTATNMHMADLSSLYRSGTFPPALDGLLCHFWHGSHISPYLKLHSCQMTQEVLAVQCGTSSVKMTCIPFIPINAPLLRSLQQNDIIYNWNAVLHEVNKWVFRRSVSKQCSLDIISFESNIIINFADKFVHIFSALRIRMWLKYNAAYCSAG